MRITKSSVCTASSDRIKFGKDLEPFWQKKAGWGSGQQGEFIKFARELSIASGDECKINETNFSKMINGKYDRRLGEKDEPWGLFWIIAALIVGKTDSAISSPKELHDFLYEVCPDCLVSNIGREWLKVNVPLVLAQMGYAWPVPDAATDTSIPSVEIEHEKMTQPLHTITLITLPEQESERNTDELLLQ